MFQYIVEMPRSDSLVTFIEYLKGIVQRKLTGVKKSSIDRYSFGDVVLGIFLNFKGTPSSILPKAFCRQLSPKYKNFMQKITRCCKSHAAPFNLLFLSVSTNLNGATEFLAPYKWCYENQKYISLLTTFLIGAANL
jgi:hypothetical protein